MKSFTKWQKNDVFLHYTGSMYGIGCAAFSEPAIAKIAALKQRSSGKQGFILLLPSADWLQRYQIEYEEDIERLLQQFWPGNTSFIFQDKQNRFPHLSQLGSIAIRVPESKSLRDFMVSINEPIISTSINIEGEKSATALTEIKSRFGDWFDYAIPQNDIRKKEPLPSTIVEIKENELVCLREGEIPFDMIKKSYEQPMILFICTANICRSPMAHHLLAHLINKEKLPYRVASAGFLGSGIPISENSKLVLEENGIDAKHHLSTQISQELAQDSWLILTMTEQHKKSLREADTKTEKKTYTVLEFVQKLGGQSFQKFDIDDPYGMDITHYRHTFQIISSCLDRLMPYLKQQTTGKKRRSKNEN
jgi:tRNA threonylcarbamoyl adenosine modification protein (Sua5/YciO/YrdC/YwlC family)